MNIILIILDGLRADHLGVSGYHRDTTPNMDKLAKKGVYFPIAVSTVPRTDPTVVSILSGLYPHSSGVRFVTDKLDQSVLTLQKILKNNGYKTIGYDIEMRDSGIDNGFDVFNPLSWRLINKVNRSVRKLVNPNYNADVVENLTNFGINQINKLKNKKFFLYMHYFSPHWPYKSPEPYENMFDLDYKGEHSFEGTNTQIKRSELQQNNKLSKIENEHAIAHYDGSIRHLDFHIGRLIESIDKLNLKEETMIIITSDHGECFGEHGIYFTHGDYLYDEAIKVPLIISYPKLPQKRLESQVQLTDLMPTILDILGIPLNNKIDGVSLVPLIMENKDVRKYTFAESGKSFYEKSRIYIEGIKGKWRMIRSNEWKLIYIPHPVKAIYELYNFKKDPVEKNNLIETEKEIAEDLKKKLHLWIDRNDLEKEEKKVPYTPSEEKKVKERLRALGYID